MCKFCCVSVTQYAASDLKSRRQTTGKSTKTAQRRVRINSCKICWPNMKSRKCNNLHILPTLYRETFLTFQDTTRSENNNNNNYYYYYYYYYSLQLGCHPVA